jgi:hypothetical protein
MTDQTVTFTDRYQALGIPYPEAATICRGHCEGTGYVPVKVGGSGACSPSEETDPELLARWQAGHRTAHTLRGKIKTALACDFLPIHRRIAILWEKCDGWHFVKCPTCEGTGKVRDA